MGETNKSTTVDQDAMVQYQKGRLSIEPACTSAPKGDAA
ncbi:hypothetical protein HY11_17005 [Hyphomonas pacifica]|nr:hypothetical protein HY11_17005 [Hyphomonas pacifica]